MLKKILYLISVVILMVSCKIDYKLQFNDSVEDITDSLRVFEDITREFKPSEINVINCYVDKYNRLRMSNTDIGKWDEVKANPDSYPVIKSIYSGDINKLFNLLEYLNKNNINGVAFYNATPMFIYDRKSYSDTFIFFKKDFKGIEAAYMEIKDEAGGFYLTWYNSEKESEDFWYRNKAKEENDNQ